VSYDPYEHMDEAERTDFEVRQHLWAQRRLAEVDQIDTKAKVEKMLAEVKPGPRFCAMFVTTAEADELEGKKATRQVCGRPGVRMIAFTGDWVCREHDPLAHPYWGKPCCIREESE
jgi:hypothetical protein